MIDIIITTQDKLEKIITNSLPDDIKPIFELYNALRIAEENSENPLYNPKKLITEALDYIGRVHSNES